MREDVASLPVPPPIQPMLCKLEETVPRGEGWIYEPKWDGFRAVLYRDGKRVHIGSRNAKPLERFFPEIVAAMLEALPLRCVMDGELVIESGDRLDFEALQLRLHPAASRVAKLSTETPARFMAFDLLCLDDEDLRKLPFFERRRRLEIAIAAKPHPAIGITPQTRDPERADAWVTGNEAGGLDGVVAKRAEQQYVEAARVMVKIKPRRTADCVVGGYRLAKDGKGVGSLLLGLYDAEGRLHHAGHTSGFTAAARREILARLKEIESGSPFEGGGPEIPAADARDPGVGSRWSKGKDMAWVPVKPELVCEVSFDRLMSHGFRHATGFLRWRTDKPPRECTYDQF